MPPPSATRSTSLERSTPANAIWSPIAPATATVMPLTARTALPLSSCSRELPRHPAAVQPPHDPLDHPREQGGHAAQHEHHAGGELVAVDVPVLASGQREEERETGERERDPPEDASPARDRLPHDAERLDHDAAQ